MGREIKFRAWDKKEKKMLYKSYSICDGFGVEAYSPRLDFQGKFYLYADDDGGKSGLWEHNIAEENNYILMQYTGLKDKNGKEIYEGDIIMPHGHGGARGRVAIASDAGPCLGMNAGWYIVYRGDWESYTALECSDEHEVIGNIYENPELMETSDEK